MLNNTRVAGPSVHVGSPVRDGRTEVRTGCGDWSERRAHLGGALGAALWVQTLEHGWVVRKQGTRIIVLTPKGRRAFERNLGLPREMLTA